MPPMMASTISPPHDDGDRAQRAAQRKRPDIAHEDLRRMALNHRKVTCAGQRGAKISSLPAPGMRGTNR